MHNKILKIVRRPQYQYRYLLWLFKNVNDEGLAPGNHTIGTQAFLVATRVSRFNHVSVK